MTNDKILVKYLGKIVKYVGRPVVMLIWFVQEGIHYLRVIAGGGVTKDRNLTEDIYKMEEEYSFPTTLVGITPESGRVERASGIYRFVSRLFNLGAGVKYNATQLVTNGNFANGTTGWSGTSSISVVDGWLKVTSTADSSKAEQFVPNIPIGSKIYVQLKSQPSDYLIFEIWETHGIMTQIQTAAGGRFSAIRTTSTNTTIRLNTHQALIGRTGYIDDVMLINLTATFGAGNEPSKEICDLLFANYFDGTKEVQLNDVIQPTANSQPYLFKKGIKNPNGGGRFMTHPTISFAANEAWSVGIVIELNGLSWSHIARLDSINKIMLLNGLLYIGSAGGYIHTYNLNNRFYGKKIYINVTYDGNLNSYLYINGILVSSNFNANMSYSVNGLFTGTLSQAFNGSLLFYAIRSGALTPTQITAEYNLLRSYFPEISTAQVGSKHIATDNCEMVTTPKGNVIMENNTAENVEVITNAADREFSSDTGFWAKATGWTISGGTANFTGTGVSANIARTGILTVGKWYRIQYTVLNHVQGTVQPVGFENITPRSSNGTFVEYAKASATIGGLRGIGYAILSVDDLSIQEVGFSGAKDLYDTLISQGSTVSAALAAAAMWRSPDSDLDKQAVFGKLYNGYAAQLLKLDIDTYNAENPTAPWGYHIATLPDFQSIKDTLGGVNTAGKKLKINGVEYWTSDNGDNTSGVEVFGSGYIDESGEYREYKEATGFWTTTENGDMLEVVTLRDELDELFITE